MGNPPRSSQDGFLNNGLIVKRVSEFLLNLIYQSIFYLPRLFSDYKFKSELWLRDILQIKEIVDDFSVLSCLNCNREKNSGFERRSSIQLITEICLCGSSGFLEIQDIVLVFYIKYYC